ncbi:MAG: serine hydrolase domain-containing protein [Saprospiraceae bacterium]
MKRIIKYIFIIFLLSILWGVFVLFGTLNGWWHQPISKDGNTPSFSKTVEKELEREFVGNFAMAIMKDGVPEKEVFHTAGKKVHKNTMFQVSSLSKFVTAVGIMKLVELGKIDLDTPVSKYLTRWQLPPSEFDNEQVTVRRLLSHTAGLSDELGYSGFENADSVQTLEASLTKAADADAGVSGVVKVGIEPNSGWKYSGGGFTLLQLLVEETSGQSFNEFMKDNLFKPLSMTSSTYIWNDSLNNRLCEFYHTNNTLAPHLYYTSLAATSLYTSLADLEIFFQIFLRGKNGEPTGRGVINPESLKLLRETHWDIMGEGIYGLGCMLYIDIENNEDIFGHDGKSTPPINTAIRINPVTGDGIIILETGNPDLATRVASDWVFLKTGKVDTLLFTMLLGKMTTILIIGVLSICIFVIGTGIWRTKSKNAAN